MWEEVKEKEWRDWLKEEKSKKVKKQVKWEEETTERRAKAGWDRVQRSLHGNHQSVSVLHSANQFSLWDSKSLLLFLGFFSFSSSSWFTGQLPLCLPDATELQRRKRETGAGPPKSSLIVDDLAGNNKGRWQQPASWQIYELTRLRRKQTQLLSFSRRRFSFNCLFSCSFKKRSS